MTLAAKAYDALRRDILTGALGPEKPLRLADLSARLGMGFSPLREALNRLQAERLVTAESLRGFRVAPVSREAMRDAMDTRTLIETQALERAICRGDDDWEAGIVGALHALNKVAERPRAEFDLWALETRHHAFHRALIGACDSAWLLEFFERLYAATERYRIPHLLAASDLDGRDIRTAHSDLAQAVLARDSKRATGLLRDQYATTRRLLETGLDQGVAPVLSSVCDQSAKISS